MKKKRKFFSFSFYFWMAFVFLMVCLFFINRAVIGRTITKIKDSPSFSHPEIINDDVKDVIEHSSQSTIVSSNNNNEKKIDPIESKSIEENTFVKEDEEPIVSEATKQKIEEPNKEIPQNTYSNKKSETREIEVYFASVNDNGVVTREKCIRNVERSLSPMVDSLKALLKGPTKEEAKHGIRSFIPADTKLISASIKEETALINLSEDFQFNRYGVEGYNIQLQQIVFTVCSFPTVKSVQFLIEGQKRDFIGSEGVWIGSPLTINSF